MSKITSPMMLDTTGQAISTSMEELVTAQKRTNALLHVLANDKISTISADMQAVRRLVQNEEIKNFFSIGDRFNVKWTGTSGTEYDKPFHIAHFGTAELTDGVESPAMYLQSHWCTEDAVQFSHPRAFFAVTAEEYPEGLPAGTYKVSFAEGQAYIVKGTTIQFTTTQVVPAGGSLTIQNIAIWGNTPASGYRITSWAANGIDVLDESLVPIIDGEDAEGVVDLGSLYLVKRNGNLNCVQEICYGCNRWDISAYRQYLNSDAEKGKWWTKQDKWDIRPNQYSTVDGYMKGLPEEFLEVVKPAKVKTYLNIAAEDGSAVETWDRFFLPSLHQMHISSQVADEGETWDYWKQVLQSSTPVAIGKNNPLLMQYIGPSATSGQYCYFRSAYRTNAISVWSVYPSGLVTANNASNAFRCVPACVIG